MSANCLKLNPEKTELLWSGSRHSLRKLGGCGPTIKLDTDTIKASDHVRLLGVIMSSDLSLEKHASVVTAAFSISGRFVVSGSHWMRSQQQHSSMRLWLLALTVALYWLIWPCRRRSQQSCSVWWTLLPASLATLKFDCGLSRLLHDELHWLDVADRVGLLKLAVLMYRCLHGTAPLYMMNSCTQTADVAGCQHLRSASQRKLMVPRYRLEWTVDSIVSVVLLNNRWR